MLIYYYLHMMHSTCSFQNKSEVITKPTKRNRIPPARNRRNHRHRDAHSRLGSPHWLRCWHRISSFKPCTIVVRSMVSMVVPVIWVRVVIGVWIVIIRLRLWLWSVKITVWCCFYKPSLIQSSTELGTGIKSIWWTSFLFLPLILLFCHLY